MVLGDAGFSSRRDKQSIMLVESDVKETELLLLPRLRNGRFEGGREVAGTVRGEEGKGDEPIEVLRTMSCFRGGREAMSSPLCRLERPVAPPN